MVKEKYIVKKREINLSITNGEIVSVVKKDIEQSACRVYKDGCIGIAGRLGGADEELMKQAEENLKLAIPYLPKATAGSVRTEHMEKGQLCAKDSAGFLEEIEGLLAILKKEYPQFLFSNKVRIVECEEKLENDAGTNLEFTDRIISLELLVKHVDSVNIFDDALLLMTRDYSKEAFLKEARERLDAFLNPVAMPEERKLPVIVNQMELAGFLGTNLNAKDFGHGTSFFNGKLGQKLFNEKFSLYINRTMENPGVAFFDAEGTTCKEDKCFLIKDGVLLRPYADKKLAEEFGYEETSTAGGAYDSIPSNFPFSPSIEASEKTLKELIGDKDAIYISTMSGGDFTNEGDFASPVQTAFLYRNGRMIGKLPEFKVSGRLYEIFGEDFIGVSSDRAYEGEHKMVTRLNCQI